MTVRRSRGVPRSGFTLIELLVVVSIIAILVSLSAAGVFKIMLRIPEVQTRTDIAEMDAALAAFMVDFDLTDPPPSTLVLNESAPLSSPSAAFLQKMFGKNLVGPIDWNGDGTPGNGTWTLSGEQCLVFYLGGIGGQGFSYNKMNPTPVAGQRTKGPYFTFQTNRLVAPATIGMTAPSTLSVYVDGWMGKTTNKKANPYAYFSTNGLTNAYNGADCVSGAAPYKASATGSFINPNKYQIISAGRDGAFGNPGIMNPPPAGQPGGKDDQANFSSSILGAGQS